MFKLIIGKIVTMSETHLLHRASLPSEMKHLLIDYPRTDWHAHSNFAHFAEFWLQRHQLFRELGSKLIALSQSLLDKKIDQSDYQSQLFRFSEFTLQQLHTHHMMEDNYFFPEISTYDPKISRAIDLLEQDHAEIYILINKYTGILHNNSTPHHIAMQAGRILDIQSEFNTALVRHLDDEEDIIVPAALHFGYIR